MSSRLISRRFAIAVGIAALWTASPLPGQERPHRLVLLGTGGGPAVKASRAQPANAVVVNGAVYVVDAGDGVARQMALAGLRVVDLRAVFITRLPLGEGVVLDPFCGSGSTLAAAEAVGYRSIGIENDPKYFDIASRGIPALASYGLASAEGVL